MKTLSLFKFSLLALGVAWASASFASSTGAYHFTDLGTLGGKNSNATGINIFGQVVGNAAVTGSSLMRAVTWNGTSITELPRLYGIQYGGIATGINNSGQITGYAQGIDAVGKPNFHSVVWQGSGITDLGTLGGKFSSGSAINNAGLVVGASQTASTVSGFSHAAVWNGTSAIDLTPTARNSAATAINDNQQIVGIIDSSARQAVLWDGGNTTLLGNLVGGRTAVARAINNAGLIAGFAEAASTDTRYSAPTHAVLWQGSSAIDLGTLGGKYSEAHGINNRGQVVGFADPDANSDYASLATLWDGGKVINLNQYISASAAQDGWVLARATAINDNGWIVGNAVNYNTDDTHAFLLTPVPEPETWAMLLAGLGLMAWATRRRKHAMGIDSETY